MTDVLALGPYSRFRVGATLLTISPAHPFIDGANVENAAYPSGVCAERAAIGAAVGGLGMRRGDFRALAVSTDLIGKEGSTDGFASPCGMCRQVIREFCDLDMPIFLHDATGKFIVKTLGEVSHPGVVRERLEADTASVASAVFWTGDTAAS